MTPEEQLVQIAKDNRFPFALLMPNGEYAAVHQLMFHGTLVRGTLFTPEFWEERWCYVNVPAAISALLRWAAEDWEGEPEGWHRHPTSGRRRTDGDPATEYISR